MWIVKRKIENKRNLFYKKKIRTLKADSQELCWTRAAAAADSCIAEIYKNLDHN